MPTIASYDQATQTVTITDETGAITTRPMTADEVAGMPTAEPTVADIAATQSVILDILTTIIGGA